MYQEQVDKLVSAYKLNQDSILLASARKCAAIAAVEKDFYQAVASAEGILKGLKTRFAPYAVEWINTTFPDATGERQIYIEMCEWGIRAEWIEDYKIEGTSLTWYQLLNQEHTTNTRTM